MSCVLASTNLHLISTFDSLISLLLPEIMTDQNKKLGQDFADTLNMEKFLPTVRSKDKTVPRIWVQFHEKIFPSGTSV